MPATTDSGYTVPGASPPRGADAGTVLHVEDTPAHRYLRRRTLESAGFRVVEAHGVAEAWDAVLRERPDVVLTDVKLPDGDGYELTRRIKAHLALATTRVVQVSALFTESEHRVRGLDSGADAYVAEPMDPAELVAILRAMVRGRRTEHLLSTLLDGSPMLIAGTDASGRIAVFNTACEALMGYSRAHVIGRPFADTLASTEDREAVLRHLQHASAAAPALPAEHRCRTASGEEVLIDWQCFPVTAPDGNQWTLCFGHDVTARRQAEAALRESESRFRLMADTSPLMIWVTDAQGNVEFVNRAYREFFGVEEEDVRGAGGWHPLVHPEDIERYAGEFMKALRTATPLFVEARVRRADGVWRHLASYGAPRLSPDGRVTGYVGSSPDITEMKEAAARISEAMRLKDEFLATVAHELRQPIQAAVTALGVMKARQDHPAAAERARAVLDRQLHQMARVVEDLLEASRIVRGDVPLHRSAVDLREVVRNSLDTTTPVVQEHRHEVEVSLPDGPVLLDADSSRLQQVLVNVLSNAAKYTPAPGRIRLLVERDARHVTVRVQDSGIGIPAEALTRIFDVFTRVEGAGQRGFGIGLAVARKLIEQHGGTIEALSGGAGKGSEFVLRLPLASPSP
jgi:PAS domain S-box-containing protein